MENILLWVAYGAFVLAFCSLVASVIIFIKAGVPDAIRFLRHKPMKSQTTTKASAKRRKDKKDKQEEAKPKKTASQPKRPTRSTEEVVEKAAPPATEEKFERPEPKSPTGTTVIGEEELPAEPNTAVLTDDEAVEDDAEKPTTVLVEEDDAERPTSLLDEETPQDTRRAGADDTEKPTTVLVEGSTSQDTRRAGACPSRSKDEDTERPTSLLADEDDTERPTSVLLDTFSPEESNSSEMPSASAAASSSVAASDSSRSLFRESGIGEPFGRSARTEEDTERPTSVLTSDIPDDDIPDDAIVSHKPDSTDEFASTFKFEVKKKVMSINTEEQI